uniref:EH domain-containing protein n=1 Tax=Pygocentrus nattereri TaxID=42514 RepID=A0AAR2IRT3_PYGNA
MMPMQQQQQGFPMVPVMQPNMQGMMGMNFGAQMPPGAMPMQGGMAMGMPAPGMQFMGQPQFMGMRAPGPQYPADLQKQIAEEQQKRLEQQQRMLEEDRKRRQFEEQKQKLRLLSSVKPKTGEKSRDDALEAIKGNLDGFSRDAKMHPTPSSQSKKPDSSPSHSSVPLQSLPPAFAEDDNEFSDFMQGPIDGPSLSFPPSSLPSSSSSSAVSNSPLKVGPVPHTLTTSLPPSTAPLHSSVISSSQSTFQGNSFLTVCLLFLFFLHRSDVLAVCLSCVWTMIDASGGCSCYLCDVPLFCWQYVKDCVFLFCADMFKKVLEFSMTPAGIDTAKLYPILMSSGLPREALGQIWASANRTTPGKLTKEELYTVLALIGVAQVTVGYSIDKLVPVQIWTVSCRLSWIRLKNLATDVFVNFVKHSEAFLFVDLFQGVKADDDDFQDFQEAPKAGGGDDSFTDFQGEMEKSSTGCLLGRAPYCATLALWPFVASMKCCFAAAFSCFSFFVCFFFLPVGEGFADFKSVSADDGFTDFKTANSVSPLDPPDQAKMFQPAFPPPFGPSLPQSQSQPPVSLAQPKIPLNMADLDLFSSMTPPSSAPSCADSKAIPFSTTTSSALPSLVLPPAGPKSVSITGANDDFGDFALFGSSSSDVAPSGQRGSGGAVQDDFADFMAFGRSGEQRSEASSQPRQGPTADKYDVFKQLSLEGGLAYDDGKESGCGGSFSSLKSSDADDFADFQSSKFCTALGASEKSLEDKVAAFKQAKEDSASVKSLDLPSIGGSSAGGKDDSEDALSVQLDMKLTDVGGDLKHGTSDSSLDLPGLTAHQPPAADADDLKCDPFGSSAVSGMAGYDWSDRDDQVRKPQGGAPGALPSSAVLHRKETSFGSSENITHTTVAKVTTFPIEDAGSSLDGGFATFADFSSAEQAAGEDDDDFGDFASTVSEKSDSPPVQGEMGPEGSDEFGAFQGDKPKFGKSDFLKASAQPKVKSSEEMIKNELATFDLSVQGSHKRSHSLGEKEIVRSALSPAPEQLFRDRSNTLSEKPALPVIRDKYKDLTGEVEESERYAYEWQRCLESALQVITTANNTLNGISSSTVCTEVIQSAQGMEYLLGVVEVYRVARRVELGIKATAVCSEKLQELLKDISRVWNNLMGFMSLANLSPDESSLDFSSCILRHGIKNAKELACGVCLLNVDSRSKVCTAPYINTAFNSETDNFKLTYGGHQYHASCANFWINCVEPKPPGLILPDLL